LKKSLKQNLIAGLIAVLPVALTILIITWLFNFFSKPGVQLVRFVLDNPEIPKFVPEFMGFLLTVLFIYVLGLVVRNVLGRQFIHWVERLFTNIPIVNSIFKIIKQITTTLTHPKSQAFQKVVMLEYPRKGLWTIVMVTGKSVNGDGQEFYHVFVPTTPNPTSGFMLFVKKTDVVETNLSVEEGLKIVISGGMVAPDKNDLVISKPDIQSLDINTKLD